MQRSNRFWVLIVGALVTSLASSAAAQVTVTNEAPGYTWNVSADAIGGGDLLSDSNSSTANPIGPIPQTFSHRGITATTSATQSFTTSSSQITGSGSVTASYVEVSPLADTTSTNSVDVYAVIDVDVSELTIVTIDFSGAVDYTGTHASLIMGAQFVVDTLLFDTLGEPSLFTFLPSLFQAGIDQPYALTTSFVLDPGSHQLGFAIRAIDSFDNSGGNPGDSSVTIDYNLDVGFVEFTGGSFSLAPGDALVDEVGTNSLFRLRPSNQERILVASDVVGSGVPLSLPTDVAVAPNGSLIIASYGSQLLRVTADGNRTVFSSTGVGTGPALSNPIRVRIEDQQSVLALDADPISSMNTQGIFRIDLATGDREIVSSNSIGSGPSYGISWGLAIEPSGSILVSGTTPVQVLRVDPVSGNRAVLGGTGPALVEPRDIDVASDGTIYLVDASLNALLAIDPISGDRTEVSSGTVGTGDLLSAPQTVRLGSDLIAFVGDSGSGARLIEIDLVTGDRIVRSSSAVGSGLNFGEVTGFTVVPDTVAILLEPGTGVAASLLGGSEVVGGIDMTLLDTEGGVLTAFNDTPTLAEYDEIYGPVTNVLPNFEVAGPDTKQVWEINYEGTLNDDVIVEIHYDDVACCAGDPATESNLVVLHQPEVGNAEYFCFFCGNLESTIDTVLNLIRFRVRGFSPFILGFHVPGCGDAVIDGGAGEECDDGNPFSADGCSATCENEDLVTLYGAAQGGSVDLTVDGVLISVTTTNGQSLADIVAAIAAAINADPTLIGLGTTAAAQGDVLGTNGSITLLTLNDPGLSDAPLLPMVPVGVWTSIGAAIGLAAAARRLRNGNRR